jgi:hypothetical protein
MPWRRRRFCIIAGQEFLPHFDFLDTAKPGYAKDVAEHGQRVLTFLLCLNDDYEGGETEFPLLGKRWKGQKGSALFFWNVEPNGMPDRRTGHAGLPPTRGRLLSQWCAARRGGRRALHSTRSAGMMGEAPRRSEEPAPLGGNGISLMLASRRQPIGMNPILIVIGAESASGLVVPLIFEAHGDAIVVESPEPLIRR